MNKVPHSKARVLLGLRVLKAIEVWVSKLRVAFDAHNSKLPLNLKINSFMTHVCLYDKK